VVVVADDVEGGERASVTSDVKKREGVSMIDERRCGNKCTVSREGTRPDRDRGIIHTQKTQFVSGAMQCAHTQIAYPYI
jgi:hypothetical protein